MKGQDLIKAVEAGLSNKEMLCYIALSRNVSNIQELAEYCDSTIDNTYRLIKNSNRKLAEKEKSTHQKEEK